MFELIASEPNLAVTDGDGRGDDYCRDLRRYCRYRLPDQLVGIGRAIIRRLMQEEAFIVLALDRDELARRLR